MPNVYAGVTALTANVRKVAAGRGFSAVLDIVVVTHSLTSVISPDRHTI